jgi:hypothetical protein
MAHENPAPEIPGRLKLIAYLNAVSSGSCAGLAVIFAALGHLPLAIEAGVIASMNLACMFLAIRCL